MSIDKSETPRGVGFGESSGIVTVTILSYLLKLYHLFIECDIILLVLFIFCFSFIRRINMVKQKKWLDG